MSWNSKFPYSYIACWRLGPCDTALYEMTFTRLVKRHSALFGIERFVAVFTGAHHCVICWATWIQSTHAVFLYHPKACFPVTSWSLMLRILRGFWRTVFCVCISNKPHANCVLHPCHTRFDEPDNIFVKQYARETLSFTLRKEHRQRGYKGQALTRGKESDGGMEKITLWAASWFLPFEIHILTNLQVYC
jgi:hypothetical protein